MLTKRDEITRRASEFLERVRVMPPSKAECQTLEVKGWSSNPKELSREIAEAATCLSNAEGGIVVIGASNKHVAPACFSPCPFSEVNPDWVEERIDSLTKPPVVCRAYWIRDLLPHLGGAPEAEAIVLGVPKTLSIELHKFQGVCYKRKDDQCPVEYSTSADDYSDRVIPGLGVDNVDGPTLDQLLKRMSSSKRYGIGRTDFLTNTGLIRRAPEVDQDQDLLTVAGLLLVGKATSIGRIMPHAQVAFSFLGGSGVSEGGRTETLNIFQAMGRFVDELEPLAALDQETLHEILINALIHRDYRAKAITEVTISTNEIIFQNPGSLLAGLSPQNLIRGHPIYRNFRLAEAARQVGLCRKYGDGIDRVYYNCLSAGFDFPFIAADLDSFRIGFSRKTNTGFARFLRERSQTLDSLDRIIVIRVLLAKGNANVGEISAALQRTPLESEKILAEMLKVNIIEASGSNYALTPSVAGDIRSFQPESRQLGLWGKG